MVGRRRHDDESEPSGRGWVVGSRSLGAWLVAWEWMDQSLGRACFPDLDRSAVVVFRCPTQDRTAR